MNPKTDFTNKWFVLYDGECGFCNHWVKWILENDKTDSFLFASLQSNFGQKFLIERNLPTKQLDTLYLWKPGQVYYTKYQAVTKITSILKRPILLALLGRLVPTRLGNIFYNIIARNRKKLMQNQCFLPSEEQRKKFIEN